MDTSPRKVWYAWKEIPFSFTQIGWLVLDQPATDTEPRGAPLAFSFVDGMCDDSDDLEGPRYSEISKYAENINKASPGLTMTDLRHVGRVESKFPVPQWLHGIWLGDTTGHRFPWAAPCRFYMNRMQDGMNHSWSGKAENAAPAPLDMNGVPVRVGDLVSTDAGEIGRVRDVAGTYDSGVTFDLLMDDQSMGLPKAGDGRAWQCSQIAVFLRADGSRPVVPAKMEDTAEPAEQPAEAAAEPEPTESSVGAEPPAQTCDRGGRVLVPGDIVVDSANHIVMRVVHTYGNDIIGDFLWQSGDTDDEERGSGSWSTKSDQVIYLSHSAA